jgi:ATP-dependent Clp protease ATP-binding subunit ClpA
MLERFTSAARGAVTNARVEARELQHPRVGTEHLLLALLADDQGPVAELLRDTGVTAATVRAEIVRRIGIGPEPLPDTEADDAAALRAIGIDLDAVRRAIENSFGPGALRLPPAGPPKRRGLLRRPVYRGTFSDRARKCLELALREAIRLGHRFIASEHVLLGILREGEGLGAQILHESGVDLQDLRTRTVSALRHRAA